MSAREPADEAVEHEFDDNDIEDYPYCMCDLEPTEDEFATNQCACCGKLLT